MALQNTTVKLSRYDDVAGVDIDIGMDVEEEIMPPHSLADLLIGGIIANQANRGRYYDNYNSSRNVHLNWCYYGYRSYRAYDNTFQPYNGRRRQCLSPYY